MVESALGAVMTAALRLAPLVVSAGIMFSVGGCSVREKASNYELALIEFSIGSGTLLPGVNLTTTFKKKDTDFVEPNEVKDPGLLEGAGDSAGEE